MSRRIWAGVMAAAALIAVAPVAFAVETLDGKTFSGTIGKKGETAGNPDDFIFKDGQFESTLCEQFGYGTGAYKTSIADGATRFSAETTSKTGGKMAWTGTIKEGHLQGSVVTTENGASSEMWFNGTVKTN